MKNWQHFAASIQTQKLEFLRQKGSASREWPTKRDSLCLVSPFTTFHFKMRSHTNDKHEKTESHYGKREFVRDFEGIRPFNSILSISLKSTRIFFIVDTHWISPYIHSKLLFCTIINIEAQIYSSPRDHPLNSLPHI
jgi:hypothetical protein